MHFSCAGGVARSTKTRKIRELILKRITQQIGQILALITLSLSVHAAEIAAPSSPSPSEAHQLAVNSPASSVKPAISSQTISSEAAAGAPAAPKAAARKARGNRKTAVASPVSLKAGFAGEIEMFSGETRVISEPNAGRLAVGNGKALSAAVMDDKEILLFECWQFASLPAHTRIHALAFGNRAAAVDHGDGTGGRTLAGREPQQGQSIRALL